MNVLDAIGREDRVDVRYSLFEHLAEKSSRVDSAVRYLKKANYIEKEILLAILSDEEDPKVYGNETTTYNNKEDN